MSDTHPRNARAPVRLKRVWIAIFLTVTLPGLGYLYVGQGKRLSFSAGLMVFSAMVYAEAASIVLTWAYLIPSVAIYWDLYEDIAMANSASRRKWIWPAVLLNVLVFGLGYLYVGNGKRPWFCIGLAVSSVLLRAARFADWLALIGYLIFLVAISWDVFKDASGFNFALSRACRAEAQRTYPAGTA